MFSFSRYFFNQRITWKKKFGLEPRAAKNFNDFLILNSCFNYVTHINV